MSESVIKSVLRSRSRYLVGRSRRHFFKATPAGTSRKAKNKIPEDKYDVLESMVEKLDEMEEKLNEQIERNISLNKRLAESVADGILDQVSEGLAATQKEKLASLSESVEFESEIQYREKLEMLKESYFSAQKTPKAQTETLSEGVDSASESVSGTMAAYLRTLQQVAKNWI